jgi:hypothetical protein
VSHSQRVGYTLELVRLCSKRTLEELGTNSDDVDASSLLAPVLRMEARVAITERNLD